MDPLVVWEDMMALLMQCDMVEAGKRASYLRTWILDGGFIPDKLIPTNGNKHNAKMFVLSLCNTVLLRSLEYRETCDGEDA